MQGQTHTTTIGDAVQQQVRMAIADSLVERQLNGLPAGVLNRLTGVLVSFSIDYETERAVMEVSVETPDWATHRTTEYDTWELRI